MYNWLRKKLKLTHHRHTGRLLARQHTSHGALVLLLLAAGIMLVFATRGLVASADTLTGSDNLTLTGKYLGPPPNQAAVILQPTKDHIYSANPVEVSGTCQTDKFVQIYRNNKLAGSTVCVGGVFGLKIDLLVGKNVLKARTVDTEQQYGPDSDLVAVTFQPAHPLPPALAQLYLSSYSNYYAIALDTAYTISLSVSGGQAPYALNVIWGDGSQDLVSRPAAGSFELTHVFHRSNIYSVKLLASDALGNKAYSEDTVLVGGPVAASNSSSGGGGHSAQSTLDIIWPIYVVSLTIISSFWLGEKYQLGRVKDLWKTSSHSHSHH